MRFEFQKINSKYIEQRIREEDARTGRKVTRVILTRAEWAELMIQEGRFREGDLNTYMPHTYWRIAIQSPPVVTSYNACPCVEPSTVRIVDVVCEGY